MSLQSFLTASAPIVGAVLFLVNMVYGRRDRHLELLQKMASEPAGSKSFQALVEELRIRAFRRVFFPDRWNLQGIFALLLVVFGIITLLLSLLYIPDAAGENYRTFYLFVFLGLVYFGAGLVALRPLSSPGPKAEREMIRDWLEKEQEKVRVVHRHEWEKPVQGTLNVDGKEGNGKSG